MISPKKLHALNEEAWGIRTTERERSAQLAAEALQTAELHGNTDEAMLARLTIASGANFRMELDEAEAHLNRVAAALTENSPREIVARHMHQRCYLHFQRGQFSEVITAGEQMMELVGDRGMEEERAWVLTTMGIVFQRMGDSERALVSYRDAEQLMAHSDNRAHLSNIKMSIGTALSELGRQQEALEILKESLNLRLSIGGDFHTGMIIGNMAKIHSQLNEHPKALVRWKEAVELLRKAGGMPYWAQSIAGMADTLRIMGHPDEAETHLAEAISNAEGFPPSILMNLHLSMARTKNAMQLFKESIHHHDAASAAINETTDHSQQVELHTGYHEAHRSLNNAAKALEHHELMHFHHQRHLNEQSVKKLADWEVLYQVNRLREENGRLKAHVTELEEQLRASNSGRETALTSLADLQRIADEMIDAVLMKHRVRFKQLLRSARKNAADTGTELVTRGLIAAAYPTLTPTELRICSMLLLDWSIKEMAERSDSSIKTIEKHRSAIRRKMGIPRSVSLTVYLRGLTDVK